MNQCEDLKKVIQSAVESYLHSYNDDEENRERMELNDKFVDINESDHKVVYIKCKLLQLEKNVVNVEKPVYFPKPNMLYSTNGHDPKFFQSSIQFNLGKHSHPRYITINEKEFRVTMLRCVGCRVCVYCGSGVASR
jgi:hypothetical protein